MRADFWMWVVLWGTSEPAQLVAESRTESGATQSELEYLFDNPTGNKLDFLDANELHLISDTDLDDLICNHMEQHQEYNDHDDFGYDHLDVDFSSDL